MAKIRVHINDIKAIVNTYDFIAGNNSNEVYVEIREGDDPSNGDVVPVLILKIEAETASDKKNKTIEIFPIDRKDMLPVLTVESTRTIKRS